VDFKAALQPIINKGLQALVTLDVYKIISLELAVRSDGLDCAPNIGWSRLRSTTEEKFGSTTEGGIDPEFLPGLKSCKSCESCQKKRLG
jgi:hypothetical protein